MSAAVLEKSDAPVEAPVDKSVAHAMSRARPAARDVDATLRAAGASLVLDAIDAATEAELLDVVERNEWDRSLSRRVQHYGHRFAYPPTERREPVSADARGVGVVLFTDVATPAPTSVVTNTRRRRRLYPRYTRPQVHEQDVRAGADAFTRGVSTRGRRPRAAVLVERTAAVHGQRVPARPRDRAARRRARRPRGRQNLRSAPFGVRS